MHSLLHITRFSRRGLRLVPATACLHESCAFVISRAYNAEAASSSRVQKTKEERRVLVEQFVDKYKASHEGQLPGISLLRKEVGGGYHILKDILQELEKEHRIHQDSARMPGHSTAVSKDDRENSEEPVSIDTGRNNGEIASTAILIAMEEIGLVAKAADSLNFEREKVDLVEIEEKELNMTGTAISFATEGVDLAAKDADSPVLNESIPEKEVLKQEPNLVAHVFDMSKSPAETNVVDSNEPVKAVTGKEGMEQKTHLAESSVAASHPHPLVESSPLLAEADDDSDLAAPEYNEPDQRPLREGSLQKDSEQSKRPPRFGLFLQFLPLSATGADLIDIFKHCGEISKATVFPLRHELSKHACGIVEFKTAEGLRAARLKKKVFVKNVEVRLDNGFTKRREYQDRDVTEAKHEINAGRSEDLDSRIGGTTAKHVSSNALCDSESTTLRDLPEVSPKRLENWDSRNVGGTLPHMRSHIFGNSEPTTLRDMSGMVSKLSSQEQLQASPRIHNPQIEVWVHAVPSQISTSEVNEAMAQFGDILNISQQRGTGANTYIVWFKNEAAANKALHQQQLKLKDQWYQIGRQSNPLTSVVRISNLSSQVTASKLRYACENIASVNGLEMRRKGIADVHFHVKGPAHIDNIVFRLSKLALGEGKLKVCLAPRFYYGNDPDKQFKPQDMQLVRRQRDTVLMQVEQNLAQLSIELQDYCELLALKRAEMLGVFAES